MIVQSYYSKKVKTLSVELNFASTLEISKKNQICSVDSILDEYFGQKKTLYEIVSCSSYMIDKRKIASGSYLVEFSWVNISPNRKVYKNKVKSLPCFLFSLYNCFLSEIFLDI